MFQPKKIITAVTLAVFASAGISLSAQSNITVAMQLEPPHLDPTSAAAGAIDSVLYSNVFEGLTRFASDGSIKLAWRSLGKSPMTGLSILSNYALE